MGEGKKAGGGRDVIIEGTKEVSWSRVRGNEKGSTANNKRPRGERRQNRNKESIARSATKDKVP